MTQFTDKAMELASAFAVATRWMAAGVDTPRARDALRQRLERGEADLEAALQDRVALAAENERLRGELMTIRKENEK